MVYKNLSTSRGDGNNIEKFFWITQIKYKNLSTSRGAGNNFNACVFSVCYRYKNLSTLRGAGNITAPGLAPATTSDTYKNLSTSRGAGNSWISNKLPTHTACIRTYLPRKGTETSSKSYLDIIHCIRTYLPREGPEINDDGRNSYISYFVKNC